MRCRLSRNYVRDRMSRSNAREIQELWSRANLPEKLPDLTVGIIDVLIHSQQDLADSEVGEYRMRIIERTLMLCADAGAEFCEEDVDFILDTRFNVGALMPA